MKKYQKLIISGSLESLSTLLNAMKAVSKGEFLYSETLSKKYAKSLMLGTDKAACFKSNWKSLLHAKVWIMFSGESLIITNITSPDYKELNTQTYNVLLMSFYNQYKSLFDHFSNNLTISSEEVHLADIISSESYDYLLQWESTCNKDNPLSADSDLSLWNHFIISLFRNRNTFTSSDLIQWLQEDRHWPSEYDYQINDLVRIFDYSINLLKAFDNGDK